MTPVQINALLALAVLLAMFVILGLLMKYVIDNTGELGCSATEYGLALIGMLGAATAGVVYVVKTFASANKGGD